MICNKLFNGYLKFQNDYKNRIFITFYIPNVFFVVSFQTDILLFLDQQLDYSYELTVILLTKD